MLSSSPFSELCMYITHSNGSTTATWASLRSVYGTTQEIKLLPPEGKEKKAWEPSPVTVIMPTKDPGVKKWSRNFAGNVCWCIVDVMLHGCHWSHCTDIHRWTFNGGGASVEASMPALLQRQQGIANGTEQWCTNPTELFMILYRWSFRLITWENMTMNHRGIPVNQLVECDDHGFRTYSFLFIKVSLDFSLSQPNEKEFSPLLNSCTLTKTARAETIAAVERVDTVLVSCQRTPNPQKPKQDFWLIRRPTLLFLSMEHV